MIAVDEFEETRRPLRLPLVVERAALPSDGQILLDRLTQLELYDFTQVKLDSHNLVRQFELCQVKTSVASSVRSTRSTSSFIADELLDEIRQLNFDSIKLKSSLFGFQPRRRSFVRFLLPRPKSTDDEPIDGRNVEIRRSARISSNEIININLNKSTIDLLKSFCLKLICPSIYVVSNRSTTKKTTKPLSSIGLGHLGKHFRLGRRRNSAEISMTEDIFRLIQTASSMQLEFIVSTRSTFG